MVTAIRAFFSIFGFPTCQVGNFRLGKSEIWSRKFFRIQDFRLKVGNLKSEISNYKIPTLSRKSEVGNFKSEIFKSRNSDLKSEIICPKSIENVCFSSILSPEKFDISNFNPELFSLKTSVVFWLNSKF